jgi:hypothetical protein
MKSFLFAAVLMCCAELVQGQMAPVLAYEFLTIVDSESVVKPQAKLFFAPAFQGRSEIPLAELPNPASAKYLPTYQQNQQIVVHQLGELTAAGWELVHVSYGQERNQYLFRKAKR